MKRNAKVLFGGLFVLGAVSVFTLFGTTLTVSATNNVVSEEVLQEKSNEEVIDEVIALAETKIGCRYTQSAEGRNGDDSFDCSGFVKYLVFRGYWCRYWNLDWSPIRCLNYIKYL